MAIEQLAGILSSAVMPAVNQAANMQLAKYQYSKDLEMWNRANDYNSPINQMKRLQDAGINPNLAYSSGSVHNEAIGQLPKFNAPTVSYDMILPQIATMLQTFSDLDVKQAQVDKIKEEALAVKNNNDLTAIQKQYWVQNAFNDAQRKYNEGKISARQFDRMQREFELDFNAKMVKGEDGKYEWRFGEDSYQRLRREMELNRYNNDALLTKYKTDFQEWYNKFVKKYKWAAMGLNALNVIK